MEGRISRAPHGGTYSWRISRWIPLRICSRASLEARQLRRRARRARKSRVVSDFGRVWLAVERFADEGGVVREWSRRRGQTAVERRESAAEGFGLDILIYAADLGVVAVVGSGSISPEAYGDGGLGELNSESCCQ